MGMTDTVRKWCSVFGDNRHRESLRTVLEAMADRLSNQSLGSAGLAIKAGGSPTVKSGAADYYACVNGTIVKVTAATDMPALSGTITASSYNVFCFFIDSGGTVTVAMGTEATTIGAVKWPPFPVNKAFMGHVLVTHSSTFTGGSTALDTATTVYSNCVGAFDPSILPS